jgi:hypothetical protein
VFVKKKCKFTKKVKKKKKKKYSSMFNCNQNYHKYKNNIKYDFKDLISKQIISQFQWGLKISVKTAIKST